MNDDYRTLTVDELAADPEVQAYVLHGQRAAAWRTWLTEHPERAADLAAASHLVEELHGALAPHADGEQVERVWSRIAASTTEASTARVAHTALRTRTARIRRIGAVALAAAAAVALLVVLNLPTATYSTTTGQQLTVWLPDSSRVVLGPASELEVEAYDDTRELALVRGEAYFEVRRGRPFSVDTERGRVEVLGTSFTVATAEEMHVACATGRVRVSAGSAHTELTPGQYVSTDGGGGDGDGLGEVGSVPVAQVGAWQRGRLYFRGAPVRDVAAGLARYYGRSFTIPPDLRDVPLAIDVPTDDYAAAIARLNFVLQTQLDTLAPGPTH